MRPSALFSALATVALAACSTSSTTSSLTPVTGIYVPASDLSEESGCGTASGEIYKYAALVSAAGAAPGDAGPQTAIAKGVYDCFVDALFLGGASTALPVGIDGTAAYHVDVVAFDQSEYSAQKAAVDDVANAAAPVDAAKFRALHGALFQCDATMRESVTAKAACQRTGRR